MINDKIIKCLNAPGLSDESLKLSTNCLVNASTQESYPFIDNIPSLFQLTEYDRLNITQKIRSFYEENPFPGYEGLEEFGELVSKANKSPFSKGLLDSIGHNKLILECGCGTGQLTNFLQLNNNYTLGIDASISSLSLAMEHKLRNNLSRSNFVHMNIFDMSIRDNYFDVVISHGVLHHTYDPELAFSKIIQKAKPGGLIVVGLYNKFARIPTWLRSKIIKYTGHEIDYVARNLFKDKRKINTWINDQYYNPKESWHTIDDVLKWFKKYNIEYINSFPAIKGNVDEKNRSLICKTDHGNHYERLVSQISWIGQISREGGLFDIIGRKR